MNHKIFIIISALCLLILCGTISLYKYNADKNVERNLDMLRTSSTEDIVRLYWNAAFAGDTATIKQLTALPPENMFSDCVDDNKEKVVSFTENETPSKIPAIVEISPSAKLDIVFSEPATENTSEFIYASRISLRRTKLKEKRIYGDEALLNLIIADSQGSFTKPLSENLFFLKRGEQGWKIVGAVDSEIEERGKIHYATQRPVCK